jgi:hypothetical protein
MDQWNGQQRAVAINMFYMFGFLQYLLGFSNFFASPMREKPTNATIIQSVY